ncbi:MAG TPA: PAS domain-containing protein [Candidatus Angelobacter sp.]|nr:PAS domain-containing protein [Candidatus Angelobacter sp.]
MPTQKKARSIRKKPTRKSSAVKVDAMLLSMIENLNVFVGICDAHFMPVYCNRRGMEMVGLDSLQQAKNTPVDEWFFPEDREFIHSTFFPAVLKRGQNEVEVRFRHFKTGEPIWMVYTVFAIKDKRNHPLAYATISHNITQRKNMEEQLRLDEKWRATAYLASGMVPWEYDPGLECFFLPPEAAVLLGFERNETRLPLRRLIARLARPAEEKLLKTVFSDNHPAKVVSLAFGLRLPDGLVREVSCRGKLFFDQGKNAMLGVFADLARSVKTE